MTVATSSAAAAVPGGPSGSQSAVSVECTHDVVLVRLAGGLDAFTVHRLRRALGSVPGAESAVVVVEMSQVDFIDTAGLGVLVSLVRRARELGVTTMFAGAVPASCACCSILASTGLP
jgi:anti-anti-sigma factor